MKYMGTKRAMLRSGLGTLITEHSGSSKRMVDLFCGGASVSWFAAVNLDMPVFACDLQNYAVVLARAVISRTRPKDYQYLESTWLEPTKRWLSKSALWTAATEIDELDVPTSAWRKNAQEFCENYCSLDSLPVSRSYGGYYFCPTQALSFDAMLRNLPTEQEHRDICLAASIVAASKCVASPGHTAQPFKATVTASKFLREAWHREPFSYALKSLKALCSKYSKVQGQAMVGDANEIASRLNDSDIVFVDPPYSAVHYSRFYHVLETIARGHCGDVAGEGRYPPPSERPRSSYSQKSKSESAIRDLLSKLSSNGCKVILTFPSNECSNGLSGIQIEEIAREFFGVKRITVKSNFSTLGGNRIHRDARNKLHEFMLILTTS